LLGGEAGDVAVGSHFSEFGLFPSGSGPWCGSGHLGRLCGI